MKESEDDRPVRRGKLKEAKDRGKENPIERIYYGATPGMVKLTDRETQVCKLVAHGLRNSEIAEFLGDLRARGAESHVRNSLCKLGLTSRVQIAIWVIKHKLIDIDEL